MKTTFNQIDIGTRFRDENGLLYEKTAEARGGCCNKKFNAFCIDTEKPAIFSRKHQVEVVQ